MIIGITLRLCHNIHNSGGTEPISLRLPPLVKDTRISGRQGGATSIRALWVMESNGDNDHQRGKQWPINIR